jgi:exodeoxyribonuclease X
VAIIFNSIFQFNCRQECYADGKVLNLLYYLKLNVGAVPHTALGDILVLEALFNRIYAKAVIEFGDDTVSKMIEVSKKPVLYRRMPFGKHKGLKLEEVPLDYLQWLNGTDLEADLRYTIERYLNF